jgi:hypothetical protein
MPYKNRIKTLEESYKLVENQIELVKRTEPVDQSKLTNLTETKNRYLSDLSKLRRAQYNNDYETVRMDDDR